MTELKKKMILRQSSEEKPKELLCLQSCRHKKKNLGLITHITVMSLLYILP